MASEDTAPADFSALVNEDGKNKTNVKCDRCGSLILKSTNSDYDTTEFVLPLAKQKRQPVEQEAEEFTTETLKDFWMVKDMYTFENIGFSNTVDNRKYLTCADCEVGPIGYHDLETKKSYIALARVKHE
ncbi:guanine nucleotide exchange factor MSS4 homolog [Anopheles arabiensis]|uniref:AGAP008798-PA n=4 Tax=gambiae species complex TaxID=44542 RepID=Q7Q852_ANOGA|nr:guanine nucleotide exchange factor MSS4 homolog [Anopheles arabiensis]XP_040163933.1 guanine nucleotide exchange factor MSS4 homolog [Anopheles arabiensis]XP_040163934.1 guanine nucleotide exchange factor MSS4 homolog [Anopheles arabiensis]XP_040232575.1 guanine nucleotide exchange factor MSS4 homolog [Anopheles coluzzii]EAA10267.3 AGAP008798-PA [Anopheles gambiae str. PEST]